MTILNTDIKAWLLPVEPLEGESLSHFLGRVRRRNHLSASALGELAGIGGVVARWEKFRHNPFPSDQELTALGDLLGLELFQLKAMLPSEPMKLEPIRLCGVCYGDSPYHRIEWQYKSRWRCDRHDLKLLCKCPNCGARFKIPSLWEFGKCDRCGLTFVEMTYLQKSV